MSEKEINYKDFALNYEPIKDSVEVEKTSEGYTVKYVTYDKNPVAPNELSGIGSLVHYHKDFVVKSKKITKEELRKFYQGEDLPLKKEYHILPVKSYIHSGIKLKLGKGGFNEDPAGWDTSHVGAVLVSKEKAEDLDCNPWKLAEDKIDMWNAYLNGEVYCAVKETFDENKNHTDMENICGIYSYEEAESYFDN